MTDQHPITPPPELLPPELVQQLWSQCPNDSAHLLNQFATLMARWGADQELEACCEWLASQPLSMRKIPDLRSFRRPKAPSLKEQALELLNKVATYELMGNAASDNRLSITDCNTIRRALEQLDD